MAKRFIAEFSPCTGPGFFGPDLAENLARGSRLSIVAPVISTPIRRSLRRNPRIIRRELPDETCQYFMHAL
jgi:hypothetical protein